MRHTWISIVCSDKMIADARTRGDYLHGLNVLTPNPKAHISVRCGGIRGALYFNRAGYAGRRVWA